MKPVLIDSNILMDVFTNDPAWGEWSCRQLAILSQSTRLFINPIIYSELSIGYNRIETFESVLARLPIHLEEIPRPALFLAGKAFLRYRRSGGTKISPLPDFFIGAHAAVRQWRLITRDPTRIETHYPSVEILSPLVS